MSESVASEVVSAMVGGIFSASALYPLEVLKTRMQAETKVAIPKIISSPPSSEEKDDITNNEEEEEESSSEEDVIHGYGQEGYVHNSSSSSSNNMKEQYAIAASKGMTSYATLMYNNEGGISPFYSGVTTSAIQSATEKALYFFAYTFYKNGYVVRCVVFVVCVRVFVCILLLVYWNEESSAGGAGLYTLDIYVYFLFFYTTGVKIN
jgi:hypothetical protein